MEDFLGGTHRKKSRISSEISINWPKSVYSFRDFLESRDFTSSGNYVFEYGLRNKLKIFQKLGKNETIQKLTFMGVVFFKIKMYSSHQINCCDCTFRTNEHLLGTFVKAVDVNTIYIENGTFERRFCGKQLFWSRISSNEDGMAAIH